MTVSLPFGKVMLLENGHRFANNKLGFQSEPNDGTHYSSCMATDAQTYKTNTGPRFGYSRTIPGPLRLVFEPALG